jgi:membrane-associated protein
MTFFQTLIDLFLHLDKNLAHIISQYGSLVYGLLFLIVFMETGFVVTPFLPGDSLLFVAGALSATGAMHIGIVYPLLLIAAILGDTVNYWAGHYVGPKIFEKDSKLIKKAYLHKAQHFYDKYGGSAILIGRFVPIVRTFAPFIAGIAKMNYKNFLIYNVVGAFVWVSIFLFAGYLFGNLPFVKENFHYVVVVIIILSVAPIVYEYLHAKFSKEEHHS